MPQKPTYIELEKRVKELNCLYAITNLFQKPHLSMEEIIREAVKIIPDGWQYPAVTCVRIVMDQKAFETDNFQETPWKQCENIIMYDVIIGALEVYYLKGKPESNEGPFLKEERALVNAIAKKLGKIYLVKSTEKALTENEERYRILSEKVVVGVTLIQDGSFVFVNRAFASTFGLDTSLQLVGKKVDEFFSIIIKQDMGNFYGPFDSEESGEEFLRKEPFLIGDNERWLEAHHTMIKYKGKPAVLSVVRDITEKRLKEMAIKEEAAHLREENISLRSSMKERYRFGDIIGMSEPMQDVYELMLKAANTDANVDIYGESGTGKELVAKAIHQLSNRREKEFVTVNCGAIPEELFESEFFGHKKGAFTGAYLDKNGYLDLADGGSLFLDELGELSLNMQVKLLRTIDGGDYSPVGSNRARRSDFRIISATNQNLPDHVKSGLMREDFFYRIHVIPITLPPLRERKEDIPLLIDHFLRMYREGGRPAHLPGHIMDTLYNYHWPGNIRELKNVMQRYLTVKRLDFMGPIHSVRQDGGLVSGGNLNLPHAVKGLERSLIDQALKQAKWNRSRAASLLGISRRALYRKMKDVESKAPDRGDVAQ
ncbi:MAG: sigma 54-interacting transcriptional regulator [Deltaproteobacteria bacterium]|nr:sigma 54-interacting transcriptional regulator [Deltaproteobacteria bacterium]